MTKLLRLAATTFVAGAASFLVTTAPACSGGTGDDADAGTKDYCKLEEAGCCTKAADCGENRFKFLCTPAGACKALCATTADCAPGEFCEDAICRPPACGNDDQCGNGEQCIGGACAAPVAAGDVASCMVLPTKALLNQGAAKTFSVVAKDASGKSLAFKGDATWSVDTGARAAAAGAVITGGAEAGALKVQASIGSVTCTPADAINYASVASGKVRVVVADLNTQNPIEGAKVVLGEETLTTDATGAATFDVAGTEAVDVHVFHEDFAYVSAFGTTERDLLLYTKASQTAAKFTGTMTARAFDNLSDLKGTVHLALHGASIAGNLIDIELDTLLGELVDTQLDLGQQSAEVPLPAGTVIGLGEQMFRTEYEVVSAPGVRTLWGLGGNAEFSKITQALAPALSGGGEDLDIGGIMTTLLPLLGRLQSGALTGQVAVAGETVNLNGSDNLSKLKLDTLLRLRVEAQLANLPTYTAKGTESKFEGAIVLGGALHGTQGLVPLGITAGLDIDGDGKVDADGEAGTTAGNLALRVAPLHSGMETSRYAALALAASFGGLISGDETDGPGLVLSGAVAFPESLSYDATEAAPLAFPTFLGVPTDPAINGQTLTTTAVTGASFHRLSVGDVEKGEWLVYFPAGATSVELPTPPTGFDNRLTKLDGDELPQALLHSIRLGANGALTYGDVLKFDANNLDDLSTRIDSFSVIEIERPLPQ